MNNLIGIVACGGQSSRMQTDKGLLQYHMLPQRYHVYHLLKQVCEDVYLSINKAQEISIDSGYKYLIDDAEYENTGPISALLTAKKQISHSSFLLIGCDYPMLDISDIEKLISNRNKNYAAVAFVNTSTNFAEPLLAIYEFECLIKMEIYFKTNQFSLRHFLEDINTLFVEPKNFNHIKSIDTIEEYELVLKNINNHE